MGAPSTHERLPFGQAVTPAKHVLELLVQASPTVQLPQKPVPSQNEEVPHGSLDFFGSASTQSGPPVLQAITPRRQVEGLVEHPLPASHSTQLPPALQTDFGPQVVPGGACWPSTQLCTPLLHEGSPAKHPLWGFVMHEIPALHDTQSPA